MSNGKPSRSKNISPFSWFFNHADMITLLDYMIHNKGKKVDVPDMEKHLGFSEFYLKKNLLKHLITTKMIKKTQDGYEFSSSQAAKCFLKLNDELETIRADLPVVQQTEDA